ncbi:MAG: hypothetical protein AAB223_03585 [Pseudomonadota bacterium]
MRIGAGDEFLRLTGGTITGAVQINVNAAFPLTLNRPDGVGNVGVAIEHAGVRAVGYSANPVEPFVRIIREAGTNIMDVRSDTGLLGTGLIPLSMLRRGEDTAQNAGVVTVLAALTSICTAALAVAVVAGDRLIVTAHATGTKGATAGNTQIGVRMSAGLATVVWDRSTSSSDQSAHHLNGIIPPLAIGATGLVTVGGTCTIELYGLSAGSNWSVAAAAANLYVLTLRDGA